MKRYTRTRWSPHYLRCKGFQKEWHGKILAHFAKNTNSQFDYPSIPPSPENEKLARSWHLEFWLPKNTTPSAPKIEIEAVGVCGDYSLYPPRIPSRLIFEAQSEWYCYKIHVLPIGNASVNAEALSNVEYCIRKCDRTL